MTDIIQKINNILWGPATIILILGCGLFFTLKTGFFQIQYFKNIFSETIFSKQKNKKSSIRALSAALAGTIGTGNIAGVATSISLGGPGAVFWMVFGAFLGMMTKYAEVVISMKFREKNKYNEFVGGPMYYIEKGLGLKSVGIIFAIILVVCSFGIGNMVQSNSVSVSLKTTLNIDNRTTGLFLIIVCLPLIMGGGKKILSATEIIVPVMALFYIIGTVIFLTINYKYIPDAIFSIIEGAFTNEGLQGGIGGLMVSKAVKFGISRGIFTNEAGLGTSTVAHSSSNENNPVIQGFWGMFEVFFDTIIICSLTALVILTARGGSLVQSSLSGMELTITAFESLYGSFGGIFIAISMIFFAVATILSWGFYGEKAINYIFGEKYSVNFIYKILYMFAIYFGSVTALNLAWDLSDLFNGLLIFPNIITLLLLSGFVINETREYKKTE